MNLYLMRHAIAADIGDYSQDSQRPLTEEGRKKLAKLTHNFEKLGLEFDLILTSPYVRTRQTAEAVAGSLNLKPELVQVSKNLAPPGDAGKLVDEINARGSIENLLVVGHEPFLSETISLLLAGDYSLSINMKKASVCKLSIQNLSPGRCATLEWLLSPAQLAGN